RRKMHVFSTLMATRATTLSPLHVEALNRIDIEFYKDRKVKDAWKALLDGFESYPKDTSAIDFQSKCEVIAVRLKQDCLYGFRFYLAEFFWFER
ncbi:MAG: hypothetical protein Q8O19_00395, partial [Rectinemataceae bacterium]|nr:hypothetical protein [Rectinemataceae bacterium]